MKVSSAPFEPPNSALANGVGPLDETTRASLSKLASLIRSQVKASEDADDAAKSDAKREEAEAKAREGRTVRALQSLEASGADDGLSREMVSRQNYPAVQRVERQMKEAARRRGAQVYKEVSRATTITDILSQLPTATSNIAA